MRVVDTSAWIEWLLGSATGKRVESALPPPQGWVVPTLVQMELAKWLKRELPEQARRSVLAFSTTCVVVPLYSGIALSAAELCAAHGLSTADAVIYATALARDADLLTCDAHFEDLEHVLYVGNRRT